MSKQHCRMLQVEDFFDKVECCFDIVAVFSKNVAIFCNNVERVFREMTSFRHSQNK